MIRHTRALSALFLLLLSSGLPIAAAGAAEDPAWLATVLQQIATSEYEISWQDRTVLSDLQRSWQAPNRAQNLRTYFTEEGVRVVSRTESEPSWERKSSSL